MSKADYVCVGLQRKGVEHLKTARATHDYTPPVQNEDITLQRETLDAEETVGNRAPVEQEYGGRRFAGGISFFARPNSTPIFASMAFGDPTTSTPTGATTARDHLFDPLLDEANAATLWLVKSPAGAAKIVDQIVGAKGGEFNMEVAANGYLGGSLAVSAVRLVGPIAEPAGATRDLTKKWPFTQVGANFAVNGAALAPIKLSAFGMGYNNGLVEDQYVIGDAELDDIPVGNIGMSMSMTPTRNLETHYRRALLDTPDVVRLQMLAVGGLVEAGFNNEFEIDIKNAQYSEAPGNANAGETMRSIAVSANPVLDVNNKLVLVRFRNGETGAKYVAPVA